MCNSAEAYRGREVVAVITRKKYCWSVALVGAAVQPGRSLRLDSRSWADVLRVCHAIGADRVLAVILI